ncbi:peptide/nickel transport system ATP-binding protein [Tistlia consotensis]|uniref:Peptide/nickel transport system ATP-binding protein n=1 Tax=Tistlia consotensis USBA 355 TaxID=560819 RepID=A0A1Y6CI21_9PROT|nr:ABC transporter ATP-binding protein [Tistlia consotensis]SMF55541.1 peptide/nickel transport system ATP-binding protein [Tistlia consotensis USBA 355]SNR88647.1 peptide/nickel transport system ATP-binding protein [Tistlia consotensis]
MALLDIRDLAVSFRTRRGTVEAVRGVSLSVARGETLAIVGESGSGKSVTSYALMRILDAGGTIKAGELTYGGVDLRRAGEREMADIRGREISMIFQNPRAALNPIRKVGRQIEDVLLRHGRATRLNARARAIEAMEAVRIREAGRRYHAYPFELSGGMCQRVVIALALACDPKLLIADEPTTGLDVTTQKAVMDLVAELIAERGLSAILITHDLGLAAAYSDRVAVMRRGELVEEGAAAEIFARPQHPYTQKLVAATPRQGVGVRELLPPEARTPAPPPRIGSRPLLEVVNLTKTFETGDGPVQAVKRVSFEIRQSESVGLVGESGCGKSTTSAMIMRLLDPTSGAILFDGQDLAETPARRFARDPRRAQLQLVFQDATDSLNPRWSARASIADPLARLGRLDRRARRACVEELAELVGLPGELLDRFPHQLSGGQKARVGIARAIALEPKLLILDEPTAALDVSIQAVVLNLLVDLKARLGMSYLFVSHDLQVVRLLCDRIVVMRGGEVVEQGPAEQVMGAPASDYTRSLLEAAPRPPSGEAGSRGLPPRAVPL